MRGSLCVMCVCVYESLSVCVCPCLLLVKVFTVHIVNELARRPPKTPTGGQAVTAQLIVVSIWAAGKGRSSAHASGNLTETSKLE